MSEERSTSEEFESDARQAYDMINGIKDKAKSAKDFANKMSKSKDANKSEKSAKAAKAAKGKKAANSAKASGKAAASGGGKAAAAAAGSGEAAAATAAAVSSSVSIPVVIVIVLVVALIVAVFYMIKNNTIFVVLHHLFPNENDIKEFINNTRNNPDDWRFQYNRMLPEEQYKYIYCGNHPSRDGGEGKEVDGLADYIIKAYIDARKAFEQDLGDIKDYHTQYFENMGKTATIDDVYPHSYVAGTDTDDLWTIDDINYYIDSNGIGVAENRNGDYADHTDWYKKGHLCVDDGIVVRKRMEEYIKKLEKFRSNGKKYSCGYFDYLIFEEPLPTDGSLPILKARAVLNIDLTYLANHDILVGDIEQALDGKIVKDSELTNVVTYLIAGMDVATCEISPSKGYLDFLKKTIGNEAVWNQSNKYKGTFSFTGFLGALLRSAEGDIDSLKYSLYTQATVKYKVSETSWTKRQKMGILDTTACEVVIMQGAEETFLDKYDKPVYQYYIVLKNPVDTDRLLWAMFVSDAAKTVTYEGIFNKICQAYQGSYYDMYCVFEPINAAIERNWFLKYIIGFDASASTAPSLAFAQWADSDEIRKYLYGLNEEEVEEEDDYFKKLWEEAEGDDKDKKYITMLKQQYLVDKNNDGTIDYNDYTGLLNETYFEFYMRPLYKCDASIDLKKKHNAAHDGYGLNTLGNEGDYDKCLWHKIFPSGADTCNACLRKNGGYEETPENLGGIHCAEWASDWPPKCPDCEKLAQHTLTGKVYVEYVRNPEPEFAPFITISKDEYKEKILGESTGDSADIGVVLTALKGNGKVDLKTNYNRYGYGDNYDAKSTITTEGNDPLTDGHHIVPDESAFRDSDEKRYYFSLYEFYGEYALKESYVAPDGADDVDNAHQGTLDLVEFNPDESLLKEFESKQEISETYNRELWKKWASSNGTTPANYRAVSVLSALYKRKYYYHNLLAIDTLEAGYYDEENGYERPIANNYGTEDDAATYNENFDKDHTSDDENDTALYGKNYGFDEENNANVNSSDSSESVTDDLDFHRNDDNYLYFYCPNPSCDHQECYVSIDEYNALGEPPNDTCLSSECPVCHTKYYVNEIPEFIPAT